MKKTIRTLFLTFFFFVLVVNLTAQERSTAINISKNESSNEINLVNIKNNELESVVSKLNKTLGTKNEIITYVFKNNYGYVYFSLNQSTLKSYKYKVTLDF